MRTVSPCILAVVLVPTGATAQPTFTQFTTVGVGVAGSPRAIVTADFDGEGDLDFATANIRGLNPASATIALWTGPSSSGPARVTADPASGRPDRTHHGRRTARRLEGSGRGQCGCRARHYSAQRRPRHIHRRPADYDALPAA